MTKITKVEKRDGSFEKFNFKKLSNSIAKALAQAGHKNGKIANKLAKEVVNLLEKRHGKTVPVEHIKQTVEFILVKNKLPKAAKAYILYRYM
jgi:anaerobic ribonucleoside-triphosphate reductase